MPRSLGNKRKQIPENGEAKGIGFITKLYGDFVENEFVKILPNEFFGYWRITVEQPLLMDNEEWKIDNKGKPKPDAKLRDYENIPFLRKDDNGKLIPQGIEEYFAREVKPHLPDLPAPLPISGEYCVYILKCSDGSFYKGQTKDFPNRLKQHNNGEVSWTSKNLPVEPLHWEIFKTRDEAVKREKYLKSGKGREWLRNEYNEKKLKTFERQAGAWIDEAKTKTGYEINFTKYFYEFKPLRSLADIKADILALEESSLELEKKVLD